jgi:hypothetical protein
MVAGDAILLAGHDDGPRQPLRIGNAGHPQWSFRAMSGVGQRGIPRRAQEAGQYAAERPARAAFPVCPAVVVLRSAPGVKTPALTELPPPGTRTCA